MRIISEEQLCVGSHLDLRGTLHLDALTLADSRKGIVIVIRLASCVKVIKGHKGPAQSDRFTRPRIEEGVLELNICDVLSPLLTALAGLTWRQQIHDAESALRGKLDPIPDCSPCAVL